MHRLTNLLGALGLAAALAACGGGYSGFVIPQETELKPWVAPSEDEILEKIGLETISEDEGAEEFVEYEDYEDEEEEEEDEDAAPAPAPAPAAKPAPKPTPKTPKPVN